MLSLLTGAVAGALAAGRLECDRRKREEKISGKFIAMFYMMNRWVRAKQQGKNLSVYFEENGYHKIAIYGMSDVGETLLEELKNTRTEVAYGIDRKVFSRKMDIKMVSPDDMLECVDAIIVTAIDYYDEIKEKLRGRVECRVISIEDVIFEV